MGTLASNIKEDWKSNTLSAAKWNNTGGAQCVVSGQQLVITTTTTATYYTVVANDKVDLTGSSVWVECVDAGNQTLASHEWSFLLSIDGSNRVYFTIYNGTIYAYKVVATVQTNLASATYNSTNHRFLRIRESGGNIYFENASRAEFDVGTWNAFTSTATPITITDLSLILSSGCWAIEATASTDKFGNVNYPYDSRQNRPKLLRPYTFQPGRAR